MDIAILEDLYDLENNESLANQNVISHDEKCHDINMDTKMGKNHSSFDLCNSENDKLCHQNEQQNQENCDLVREKGNQHDQEEEPSVQRNEQLYYDLVMKNNKNQLVIEKERDNKVHEEDQGIQTEEQQQNIQTEEELQDIQSKEEQNMQSKEEQQNIQTEEEEKNNNLMTVKPLNQLELEKGDGKDVGMKVQEKVNQEILNTSTSQSMDDNWRTRRSRIRYQLSSRYVPKELVFLKEQSQSLQARLERTVIYGENHSVLVVGSPGCGKKLIVKHALQSLSKSSSKSFVKVHLNGVTLQDDNAAFKEIVRQLSIPSSIALQSVNYEYNQMFLLDALRDKKASNVSVIFILDQFDLFATKSRQMLLYHLLDWMHSDDVNIAILGLTRNHCSINHLEKRVKSRFSSHQIVLTYPSFPELLQILKAAMRFENDTSNQEVWNKNIENLFEDETFCSLFRYWQEVGKSIRWFFRVISTAVSRLTEEAPFIDHKNIEQAFMMMQSDIHRNLLVGISILEISLLLSMRRLEFIPQSPYTFEMVYKEYSKYVASIENTVHTFNKCVCLKAFQHLIELGLVEVMQDKSKDTQQEYQVVYMVVHPSYLEDAIVSREVNCPPSLRRWGIRFMENGQ